MLGASPADQPQMLMIPTSSGMYQCILTQFGHLMYCMESFYEGQNVTNARVVNEEEMLVSYTTSEGATKLVIINLETREEKVVIHPDASAYFLDLRKIPSSPGSSPFFIVHTGKGL